ncbi:MAG: lanthionine synthetase LanC family protein, partial [Janthinobacterium lividum]
RLSVHTGDTRFADAAAEAVAYEDTTFVPSMANWRDLREEAAGGPVCSTRWCHGAPGIALARMGGLPALDNTRIRQDIDTGLQTTQEFGLEGLDHLCCGNLGRAEVLLSAGRRLGRPELTLAAQRLAGAIVTRADASGSFLLHPLSSQVYAPGLFQGAAGVVYSLLRLAHPDQLRSVLLWE